MGYIVYHPLIYTNIHFNALGSANKKLIIDQKF